MGLIKGTIKTKMIASSLMILKLVISRHIFFAESQARVSSCPLGTFLTLVPLKHSSDLSPPEPAPPQVFFAALLEALSFPLRVPPNPQTWASLLPSQPMSSLSVTPVTSTFRYIPHRTLPLPRHRSSPLRAAACLPPGPSL